MSSDYLAVIPRNITASPESLTVTSKSTSVSSRTRESSACRSPFEPSRRAYGTPRVENGCPNANTYTTASTLNRPAANGAESRAVADARAGTLYTLSVCRNVIMSLEVTRIRKSRVGFIHWQAFWLRIYARPYGRMIATRVAVARFKIEQLFRFVAHLFQRFTQRTEECILQLHTEDPIWESMRILETTVVRWRHRRRKRAQKILNKMRLSIEAIPVTISDDLFIDMKRGVFALDAVCDYHPGDPQAEARERRFDLLIYPCGGQRVALSPGWYHEWQNVMVCRFANEVRWEYALRENVDIGQDWMHYYMSSDEESSPGSEGARDEDGVPVRGA